MATQIAYIDREGKPLSKEEWTKRQADPAYVTVRQYDNAVVQVTLKWNGRIQNPQNTYADYWPLFILLVKNYRPDGSLAVDPADSDKTFSNETAGIAFYEEFLLKWTESSRDAEGDFMEADNMLAPPESPDPNRPVSQSEELGDVGAW